MSTQGWGENVAASPYAVAPVTRVDASGDVAFGGGYAASLAPARARWVHHTAPLNASVHLVRVRSEGGEWVEAKLWRGVPSHDDPSKGAPAAIELFGLHAQHITWIDVMGNHTLDRECRSVIEVESMGSGGSYTHTSARGRALASAPLWLSQDDYIALQNVGGALPGNQMNQQLQLQQYDQAQMLLAEQHRQQALQLLSLQRQHEDHQLQYLRRQHAQEQHILQTSAYARSKQQSLADDALPRRHADEDLQLLAQQRKHAQEQHILRSGTGGRSEKQSLADRNATLACCGSLDVYYAAERVFAEHALKVADVAPAAAMAAAPLCVAARETARENAVRGAARTRVRNGNLQPRLKLRVVEWDTVETTVGGRPTQMQYRDAADRDGGGAPQSESSACVAAHAAGHPAVEPGHSARGAGAVIDAKSGERGVGGGNTRPGGTIAAAASPYSSWRAVIDAKSGERGVGGGNTRPGGTIAAAASPYSSWLNSSGLTALADCAYTNKTRHASDVAAHANSLATTVAASDAAALGISVRAVAQQRHLELMLGRAATDLPHGIPKDTPKGTPKRKRGDALLEGGALPSRVKRVADAAHSPVNDTRKIMRPSP